MSMSRSLFYFLTFVVLSSGAKAQVTIGGGVAPQKDAVLELISGGAKGLLLPRVALTSTTSFSPLSAHVAGMVVYNTTTISDVTPGYYYDNGVKWIRIADATGGDLTNDAWVNSGSNVILGTKANGTSSRDAYTDIVFSDTGRLGLGTQNPYGGIHIFSDNDGYKDDVLIESYNTTPGANVIFQSSAGTAASPVNLSMGNAIGQFNFLGRVNGSMTSLARIYAEYKGDGTTTLSGLQFSVNGYSNNSLYISNSQNVGINTSYPSTKLHIVSGGTSSSPIAGFRLDDGNQVLNKVLTTDANGVGTWQYTALDQVLGTIVAGSAGVNTFTITSAARNLGSYITLPPGKWNVTLNILLDVGNTQNNSYTWARFSLTDTSSSTTISSDITSTAKTVAGGVTTVNAAGGDTNGIYGIANGDLVVTNSTGANKTYYLLFYNGSYKYTARSLTMAGTSTYTENYISATRVR